MRRREFLTIVGGAATWPNLGTLSGEAKATLRDMVKLAYLDGESDGARSYAATAWVVKGKVPT